MFSKNKKVVLKRKCNKITPLSPSNVSIHLIRNVCIYKYVQWNWLKWSLSFILNWPHHEYPPPTYFFKKVLHLYIYIYIYIFIKKKKKKKKNCCKMVIKHSDRIQTTSLNLWLYLNEFFKSNFFFFFFFTRSRRGGTKKKCPCNYKEFNLFLNKKF